MSLSDDITSWNIFLDTADTKQVILSKIKRLLD
jgi:hypothetical protein